ncbi:MAG: GNAT family N-acetyltransferase [Thermodesulfobacteriota bacterium]
MDRLVRLYDLPPAEPHLKNLLKKGVTVRTAMAYEKAQTVEWVRNEFSEGWADESSVAFSNHPVSCFIATEKGAIIGFACYESTCRNFFGPIGVAEHVRGHGIGRALLLSCLHAMAASGYAYAIIGGGDGARKFYAETVGAIEIEGSSPGIYRDRLKNKKN